MADIIEVTCPRCGLQAIETQDQSSRSPVSGVKNNDVTTQHVHLRIRKIVRCVNLHQFAVDGELTLWRRN
jgi:hypothetical protein